MATEEQAAFKVTCRRKGFDAIWSGVEAAEALKIPLYEAFERGERAGDRRLLSKLITDVLEGKEWQWVWMCQCAATFEALGIWPLAWRHRFVPKPFNWAKVSPYAKIDFLAAAMSRAAWTAFRLRDIEDPVLRPIFQPRLSYNDQCAASAYFAEIHGSRIGMRDFSVLPPYFPGDTCWLDSQYIRRPRG